MRISEMEKDDLVQYMKASGEIHRFNHKDESWKRAFKLYNERFGDRLIPDCAKCVNKVWEWLRS